MTGHHEVAAFEFAEVVGAREGDSTITVLPPGWKPFSTVVVNGRNVIIARRWVRNGE